MTENIISQYVTKKNSIEPINSTSATEELFAVEKVLDMKEKYRNGKKQKMYLLKWRGYGNESNSWEPEINLIGCKNLIEEFMKMHQHKKQKHQNFEDKSINPKKETQDIEKKFNKKKSKRKRKRKSSLKREILSSEDNFFETAPNPNIIFENESELHLSCSSLEGIQKFENEIKQASMQLPIHQVVAHEQHISSQLCCPILNKKEFYSNVHKLEILQALPVSVLESKCLDVFYTKNKSILSENRIKYNELESNITVKSYEALKSSFVKFDGMLETGVGRRANNECNIDFFSSDYHRTSSETSEFRESSDYSDNSSKCTDFFSPFDEINTSFLSF